VDLYTCTAYDRGIKAIRKDAPGLNVHYSGESKKSLEETDFFKSLLFTAEGKTYNVKQKFLKTLLQCQDSKQGYSLGTAVMFPYMSPNNNSIFSANMIQYLFSGAKFAIKNIEKDIVTKAGNLEYPPQWLAKLIA
jgi:hypothetical protein